MTEALTIIPNFLIISKCDGELIDEVRESPSL